MKKKKSQTLGLFFGSGIVVGAILGVCATNFYQEKKTMTSAEILKKVQAYFKKEGTILTSWIHDTKEPFHQFAVHSKVYNGGIILNEEEKIVTYEFMADAFTGTVLHVKRMLEEEKK